MAKNLRLSEAAEVLGVSIRQIREIARSDPTFPLVKFGERTNRVSEADLQRYVEGKKVHTAARRPVTHA